LYHASAASSTPHPASLRYPHPTRLSLMNESCRDRKNAFSYTIEQKRLVEGITKIRVNLYANDEKNTNKFVSIGLGYLLL
jgi:hypothetical protein